MLLNTQTLNRLKALNMTTSKDKYSFKLPFRVQSQNAFWSNNKTGRRYINAKGEAYREDIIS